MIEILFETEGFYLSFPENHEWNYWWGWGQHGWRADDGISANRPEYEGSEYIAHISYRTIDAMAMLNVGRLFPEALPDGLLDYIQQGVEDGGLYLFVSEELYLYGRIPAIPRNLAVQYLRMNSPWEIQNTAWAYRALGRQLSQVPAAASKDRGR